MPRTSAFKGTWEENKRPYIVLAPDAYVAIQGQTTIVTCGECNRIVNVNKYLTGISTETTVDSPPGSATINLSIPDTDVNDLYVEGNFVIIPMMEIEIFAKGYYTVGGLPQYYKIFWGMVTNISKSWSDGVTSFTISCKDMLHWWEKTNIILNPAFAGNEGASTGYPLFQNQFAGLNPYTIIIALAKEAMGDFSITDGSFTSEKPEVGPESAVVGQYAKDIMAYWQLKFGNIWNSLVLYGTSGIAYTFEGAGMDIDPKRFASSIFRNEIDALAENKMTGEFKVQPHEIAAFKVDYTRAGDVQFFQNDTQSKLSVALTARDQILYEFYCDTTGDIIFKPPFYNLNVIPNKPVSWINDFEIIEDNINDTEAEVVTHMTSSGNAFGGVNDYGLTDEMTVPRTGVIDWHLLKRYGWLRRDFQCEWAGNPKKLFWFLIDMMDRVNAKRHNGTVTIPMRPEIRMGFPVWIPFYDSFYYVTGVSHNYSPGGQATTQLSLSAKRSKFIAPKNIGRIVRVQGKPENKTAVNAQSNKNKNTDKKAETKSDADKDRHTRHTYAVTFDGAVGQTAGLGDENEPNKDEPLIMRDPTTGKLLGYPNVVMVYRTTFAGEPLVKQSSGRGKVASHTKSTESDTPSQYRYDQVVRSLYTQLRDDRKAAIVSRIRLNRYEAGMTNAGLYDYAVDANGDFKEMVLIPITSILWGTGTKNPADVSGAIASNPQDKGKKGKGKAPGNDPAIAPASSSDMDGLMGEPTPEAFQEKRNKELQEKIDEINKKLDGEKTRRRRDGSGLISQQIAKKKELDAARADLLKTVTLNHKNKSQEFERLDPEELSDDEKKKQSIVSGFQAEYDALTEQVNLLKSERTELGIKKDDFRLAKNLNVSVRPVSDEFGFEVIGHNRFGRGVFVDRGQLRLRFQSREVNPLRIQFSATGSMLTDPPTNLKFGLQPDNTPEAFEKMQPEDWITGASTNTKEEVTLTSVNTFSSAINHQIEANTQIGAVFIEADSTRRAKTIWELQPTVSTGLDEVGFPSCDCKLSRFQWYSLLPKKALQSILSVQGTEYVNSVMFIRTGFIYVDALTGEDTQNETTRSNRSASDAILDFTPDDFLRFAEEERNNHLFAIYERKDSRGKVVETIREPVNSREEAPVQIERRSEEPIADGDQPLISKTKPDFFAVLNQYLMARFDEAFEYNKEREERDVGLDLGVEIIKTGNEGYIDPNSVLGDSGGSLFDRASLGDPQALEALQNQANWEWSKSKEALDELKTTAKESLLGFKSEEELEELRKASEESRSIAVATFYEKEIPVGSGSTIPQPQPFTPPPLKINTKRRLNLFENAQETNPFDSNSHTGDLTILPLSPKAPKR